MLAVTLSAEAPLAGWDDEWQVWYAPFSSQRTPAQWGQEAFARQARREYERYVYGHQHQTQWTQWTQAQANAATTFVAYETGTAMGGYTGWDTYQQQNAQQIQTQAIQRQLAQVEAHLHREEMERRTGWLEALTGFRGGRRRRR